jgi:hypothetical protein
VEKTLTKEKLIDSYDILEAFHKVLPNEFGSSPAEIALKLVKEGIEVALQVINERID